jgi:UTP--glucose-1-phosphate uridylyltransferase
MKPYPKIRKLVMPVAGLGTRFLPATKIMPKEMLTLLDRPLIQHAVEEAFEAGIEQIIFVTNQGKDMLENHFQPQEKLEFLLEKRGKDQLLERVRACNLIDGQIASVTQGEPLGLGHAVWCAHHLVGQEPFAVLLPDDVVLHSKGCLKQMIEAYEELGGTIIATEQVPPEDTRKYGILALDDHNQKTPRILDLVEKPAPEQAPSQMAIIGRYILQPDIFDKLSARKTGAGGEIQLTDALSELLKDGHNLYAYRYAGQRYDCGQKLGFIVGNVAYGLQDPTISAELKKELEKLLDAPAPNNFGQKIQKGFRKLVSLTRPTSYSPSHLSKG